MTYDIETRKLKPVPGFEPGTRIQEFIPLGKLPEEYLHGIITDHYVGMDPWHDDVPRMTQGYGIAVTVLWDNNLSSIGYCWCRIGRIMKEEN